ncbi:sensor domain-containing diguanylate cyclase [Pseudoxanthomonas winnipegensis]|nr:GGDEF domain-containing protein [Pseudoxanthomonas winnipegensis]
MTSDLASRLPRLLCLVLLLVLGLAACAPASQPRAFVVSGQPALAEEHIDPCRHQHRPGHVRIPLAPPVGGWPGTPQAALAMNIYQGQVEIRHGARERCGTPLDARTLDSRFRTGMGTVLVPPRGNLQPIEVEFDQAALPLWRPIVMLGEPAVVQRQDTLRFSMRVACLAVVLSLVLSCLLTFIATRERAFLSAAIGAVTFALWIALLSGLWTYPRPWLPLDEPLALRLIAALPTAMIGLALRTLRGSGMRSPRLYRLAGWVSATFLLLSAVVLVLPEAALRTIWLLDGIGFVALCVVLAARGVLALVHRRPGGAIMLACLAPLVLAMGLELFAPALLALWEVETLMVTGVWLGLTASMALTLRLRQQRDQMRLLAQTDALTGLPNRGAALERLAQARAGAQQEGRLLTVCFLDIDHFKDINDRYGHDVGDRVLERVAATLRAVFRGQDYVARMGGEEFLVMLPDAEPSHALRRIDALREPLDAIAQDLGLPGLRVTLSTGITGLLPQDRDTRGLLQRADAAMYAAKRAGRDRATLADVG